MCVCVGADLFGDVLTLGLRGEGRSDWEVWLRYGVKMNRMITSESMEFIYLLILYTFIHLFLSYVFEEMYIKGSTYDTNCIKNMHILSNFIYK